MKRRNSHFLKSPAQAAGPASGERGPLFGTCPMRGISYMYAQQAHAKIIYFKIPRSAYSLGVASDLI